METNQRINTKEICIEMASSVCERTVIPVKYEMTRECYCMIFLPLVTMNKEKNEPSDH